MDKDITGKAHGLTCNQVRTSLIQCGRVIKERAEQVRRNSNMLRSERAMALSMYDAQIKALESVLPPPSDQLYNGRSEA